jgi:hypothetical protein
MKARRVEVDEVAVAAFHDELEAMIDGVPAAMINNADETGCSDWAHTYEIRVLVPDTYPVSSTAVQVGRPGKRATLLGCIAADGPTIRPMIVVERVAMESDIRLAGCSSEKVDVCSQSNGYMMSQLFER